jgi:hypothetical protein
MAAAAKQRSGEVPLFLRTELPPRFRDTFRTLLERDGLPERIVTGQLRR